MENPELVPGLTFTASIALTYVFLALRQGVSEHTKHWRQEHTLPRILLMTGLRIISAPLSSLN